MMDSRWRTCQILASFFLSCLLFVGGSTSLQAQEPPGQIGVSPSLFEFPLAGMEPVDKSLQLMNMKKKPVRVKVEVYNWTLDADNRVELLPPNRQSLDQWILIQPVDFTVAPGKSQTVRFSVRPRSKPEPGEHRAMIYFVEQPTGHGPENSEAEESSLQLFFKLGVGVYAYAEPVVRKAALHGVRLGRSASGGPEIQVDLENRGNVHTRITGTYSIWEEGHFPGFTGQAQRPLGPASGQERQKGYIGSGSLDNSPVLPGQRRSLKTGLVPLPAGKSYSIAVQGRTDSQSIEQVLPYTP